MCCRLLRSCVICLLLLMVMKSFPSLHLTCREKIGLQTKCITFQHSSTSVFVNRIQKSNISTSIFDDVCIKGKPFSSTYDFHIIQLPIQSYVTAVKIHFNISSLWPIITVKLAKPMYVHNVNGNKFNWNAFTNCGSLNNDSFKIQCVRIFKTKFIVLINKKSKQHFRINAVDILIPEEIIFIPSSPWIAGQTSNGHLIAPCFSKDAIIKWYHLSKGSTEKLLHFSNSTTFSIGSVTKNNSGWYKYKIFLRGKFFFESHLSSELIVQHKPLVSSLKYSSSLVNKELHLNCEVTDYGVPKAAIIWLKDEHKLAQTSSTTFTVGRLTNEKTGIYTCLASNSIGNSSRNVHVYINSKPKILSTLLTYDGTLLDNRYLKDGSGATLSCVIEQGYANSTIYWLLKPKYSDLPPLYSSFVAYQKAVYRIEKMTKWTSGNYTCHAANAFGLSESLTKIQVEVAYLEVIFWPNKTLFVIDEKYSSQIILSIDAFPLEFNVSWMCDDTQVDNEFGLIRRNSVIFDLRSLKVAQQKASCVCFVHHISKRQGFKFTMTTLSSDELHSRAMPTSSHLWKILLLVAIVITIFICVGLVCICNKSRNVS